MNDKDERQPLLKQPLMVKAETVSKEYKEQMVHFMQTKLDEFIDTKASPEQICKKLYQQLIVDDSIDADEISIRYFHVAVGASGIT